MRVKVLDGDKVVKEAKLRNTQHFEVQLKNRAIKQENKKAYKRSNYKKITFC